MTKFTLTREDRALFEALQKSALGDALVDYVERLCDYLCDGRNMKDVSEPTRLGHVEGAKILESNLVAYIKVPRNKKPTKPLKDAKGRVLNPFE